MFSFIHYSPVLLALIAPTTANDLPLDARYQAFESLSVPAQSSTEKGILPLGVPEGYVSRPWYPTPHGGFTPDWAASYAKAARLVANMTLAEKTNITSGTGYFMDRCVGNTGSAEGAGFPQLCL